MMAGSSVLVSLHGATVAFGDLTALRDAEVAVRVGEVVAVVGANGSGKTTLLRALHGVVALSGGRRVMNEVGVQAMIFQRPFLLRLSVWNNLRLGLWLARRDWPRAERHERAQQALRRVGLAALRNRPARALSGGEQQRLALARGWAVRPAILFLDEPTANLDPSAKKEVESLLAGFAAEGMTLVMSTHNLGQAKRLATRVVYMDGGRIDTDLPTQEFFASGARGRADLFLKGELSWSVDG
jgi:tungstate transport system ATP-binding protein